MKIFRLLFLFFLIHPLPGCLNKSFTERVLKELVISIAEEYAANRLDNSRKTIGENGIVTIGNNEKSYIIDPSKILTGLIDDDQTKDAIISLDTYYKDNQTTSEHLIITNSGKKMMLNRAVESDMKVLGIKDRFITAEVPSHSRNSPLFNCASCREVVKYRFQNGDLIKSE